MIENARRKPCEQAADEQSLTTLKALTFETCSLLEPESDDWRAKSPYSCSRQRIRNEENTRRPMPKP
jgi:hypothetical protein